MRPVENVVGTDTVLEDVEPDVCYSAGYAARWVLVASSAANDRSRRETSGGRTALSLQTN